MVARWLTRNRLVTFGSKRGCKMAINFPSSPIWGQVHNVSPGNSFVWYGEYGWEPAPLKTAHPKNYIVNPSTWHSQENGDVTISPGAGVAGSTLPADDWWLHHSAIPTVAIATLGQLINVNGINRWVQFYTNQGPVTTGASDNAQARQYLEGQRLADWKWGTTKAQDLVLRFDGLFPTGQQYSVSIATPSHSWLAPFTGNGGYQTHTFIVPGLTSGTFNTDNTFGCALSLVAVSGSGARGVAGWQTGWKDSLPGQGSFIRGTGSTFAFSNVGLYLDPYKTGVAPPYEHPDQFRELRRSQRYFAKLYGMRGWSTGSNGITRPSQILPAGHMRVAPTIVLAGTPNWYDSTATAAAAATIAYNGSNNYCAEFNGSAAAGLTGGRPAIQFFQVEGSYWAANARM